MNNVIHEKKIDSFTSLVVAAGTTSTEFKINFDTYRSLGNISLQIAITGDGTAKIHYTSSNDDVTYAVAEDASDIITSMTVGEKLASFEPVFSKYMKIYVTETGGADSVTITKAILAIQ